MRGEHIMRKFRKILAVALAATMITSMGQISMTAFAASEDTAAVAETSDSSGIKSGSCGENVTYTLDTDSGLLTISGTGAMGDFNYGNAIPWKGEAVTGVVIEDGVTTISDYTFSDCSDLTSVTLPNTLTSIGSEAFSYCSSLQHLSIPDSVTTISHSAFGDCTQLKSIAIPYSVKSIGIGAFGGCSSLESIVIPDSVTTIDMSTFRDCTQLKSIVIPDSVESIGAYAFAGCLSLESIVIPDSVITIDEAVFRDCTQLKSIELSNNLKLIDSLTFSGCSSLESIVIPDSVKSICYAAFSGCSSLESFVIPDSVESIGEVAFEGCSFSSIVIPETVRIIYNDAFSQDVKIYGKENGPAHAYVLKHSNEFVSTGIYHDDYNFTENLNCKFDGKTGVLTISGTGDMPDFATIDWGSKSYTPWSGYLNFISQIVIEEGVTSISGGAFLNGTLLSFDNLESITIPDSVISIPFGSMPGDYSMPGDGGTYTEKRYMIYANEGSYAYQYALDNELPINDIVQGNCGAYGDNLQFVFDKRTEVLRIYGEGEMADYDYFNNTYYPDSISPWRDGYQCKITQVIIEEGVTSIGDYAFQGCDTLESISFPSTLTSIGRSIIEGDSSLKSINIPASVTYMEYDALTYSNLENISVDNNNQNYCSVDGVLFNKDKTTLINYPTGRTDENYVVPDSVNTIENAFFNCTSLKKVIIPESVISIDFSAFICCDSLTIYGVKDSRANTYADEHCIPFVEISLPSVAGYSVSLRGNIGLNYYVDINSYYADQNAVMTFCKESDGSEIASFDISEAVQTEVNGKSYYMFTCPLPASYMSEKITAKLTADGTDFNFAPYSVKEYADYILDNSDTYANETALVKAMLNYGAYSEIALRNVETSETNAKLSDDEKMLGELPDLSENKYTVSGTSENIKYAGSVISLKTETVIRHYFKLAEGADINSLNFTVNGETVTPVADGSYYRIDITGVNAVNIDKNYQVMVDGVTLDYSVLSYVNSAIQSENISDDVKNSVKALYFYCMEAKKYNS